ncbi:hypothetical protein ACFVSN_30325 [Kitasatospora sp. NPDC057904]|uniref:hypothetical protein n=1 Tax=unclassified Kitasatospora TaxID=2633591 RepID=UPI0036DD6DE2
MAALTANPPALLDYTVQSVPTILRTSPIVGELDSVTIDMVISDSRDAPVCCAEIRMIIPIGKLPQDLAASAAGITPRISPDTWTAVMVQDDVLVLRPQSNTATFSPPSLADSGGGYFTPIGEDDATLETSSLTLRLSGVRVSRMAGIANVEIEEFSFEAGEDSGDQMGPRHLEIPIGTFPSEREGSGKKIAGNFSAHLPTADSGTNPEPATLVPVNTPVVLDWLGPAGATHRLYHDGSPEGFPVSFPYETPRLTRDTTFTLDTALGREHYFATLTVTVDAPVLPALTLDTLTGVPELTIGAPVVEEHALDVMGTLTARNSFVVPPDKSITAGHTETVQTGTGTTTELSAGSSSTVEASALEVAGELTTEELLSIKDGGHVQILGPVQNRRGTADWAMAPTNGFFQEESNTGWVTSSGNLELTSAIERDYRDLKGSVCLPVNEGYQCAAETAQNTPCYWIPIGIGPLPATTRDREPPSEPATGQAPSGDADLES